jgi:hypothetical protein
MKYTYYAQEKERCMNQSEKVGWRRKGVTHGLQKHSMTRTIQLRDLLMRPLEYFAVLHLRISRSIYYFITLEMSMI